jgi:hypothetical protein
MIVDINMLKKFIDESVYDFKISKYDKYDNKLPQDKWIIVCSLKLPKSKNIKILPYIMYNEYIQRVRDFKLNNIN